LMVGSILISSTSLRKTVVRGDGLRSRVAISQAAPGGYTEVQAPGRIDPMALTITINVEVGLSSEAQGWIMSLLSDAIAKVQSSTDAATTRVQTDIAGLRDQIVKLQAQIDAGGATAADLAALAALQAQVDAIDPTNVATLPSVTAASRVASRPK
jgi:hypothetical protein